MSSKEFVDATSNGSNLEAEDAFKSAMSQKIGWLLYTSDAADEQPMVSFCARPDH